MRIKKHIWLPVALLIYLVCMAYLFYPGKTTGNETGYTQYYITIGVTVIVILALSFFLKKKDKNNQKYKKK